MRRRDLIAAAFATGIAPVARAARHARRPRTVHLPGLLLLPTGRRAPGPACATADGHRARLARGLLGPPGLARPVRQPRRRPPASGPMRGNSAAACSPRRWWWTARMSSSVRSAPRSKRRSTAANALPVALTLSRAADAVAVEVGAAPGPVRALRIVYDPEHATDVAAGENDGERLRE